jgi:hypothetical protein
MFFFEFELLLCIAVLFLMKLLLVIYVWFVNHIIPLCLIFAFERVVLLEVDDVLLYVFLMFLQIFVNCTFYWRLMSLQDFLLIFEFLNDRLNGLGLWLLDPLENLVLVVFYVVFHLCFVDKYS